MDTEVAYVRLPIPLKTGAEELAERHGTSLARVVARALEVYLPTCGIEVAEGIGRLP